MEFGKTAHSKEISMRQQCATMKQRITSRIWESNELDPYQTFKVTNKKCLLLRVQVYHGKNISKGWRSLYVFKPNPYVILDLRGTPNRKKKTPVVEHTCNPVWNVCFQFLVDPNILHDLYITLMDKSPIFDRKIGTKVFKVHKMKLDIEKVSIIEFKDGSRVSMVFSLVKSSKQDLRFSLSLSREEISFVRKRRMNIFEGMEKFLGSEFAPKEIREVPIVAIINSGGGIRAVVASSGVHKALHECGLLDCVMYVAGLSGSSWYLTYLYTHPDFPENVGPGDLIPEIREKIAMDWKRLLTLKNICIYLRHLSKKASKGQSVSFTDIYGHLIGEMLLEERKNLKLSGLKEKLEMGMVPMPLFTCVVVKKHVSARVFQAYVEFSPYEIGLPEYGAFMKTENFGSEFYVGKIVKQYDEMPFHYLIGVWGSAFSILFKRLVDEEKSYFKLMFGSDKSISKKKTEILQECVNKEDKEEQIEDIEEVVVNELDGFINSLEKDKYVENLNNEQDHETLIMKVDLDDIKIFKKYESDKSEASDSTDSSSNSVQLHKKVSFHKDRGKYPKDKKNRKKWMMLSGKKETAERTCKDKYGNDVLAGTINSDGESLTDVSDASFMNRSYNHRKTYYEDIRLSYKASDHTSFWHTLLGRLGKMKWIRDTRAGRAGVIFNPLRALSLSRTYPISPNFEEDTGDTDFQGTEEPIEAYAKKLCLVDAGLVFNSPFPLLLRPQRAVDVFISFDYSSRPADFHEAFGELVLAEKWAIKNKVLFPPVQELVKKFYDEPIREIYVFKHPDNLYCPILVHCIIFNGIFKEYKLPGIKRETSEEFDFADFKIFSDPENPYSSYKYTYTPLQFDRLCKLMEFNTLYGMNIFRKILKYAVMRKKKLLAGQPMTHLTAGFQSVIKEQNCEGTK